MDLDTRLTNLLKILQKRDPTPDMLKRIESVKLRIAKLGDVKTLLDKNPELLVPLPTPSPKKKKKVLVETEVEE